MYPSYDSIYVCDIIMTFKHTGHISRHRYDVLTHSRLRLQIHLQAGAFFSELPDAEKSLMILTTCAILCTYKSGVVFPLPRYSVERADGSNQINNSAEREKVAIT